MIGVTSSEQDHENIEKTRKNLLFTNNLEVVIKTNLTENSYNSTEASHP